MRQYASQRFSPTAVVDGEGQMGPRGPAGADGLDGQSAHALWIDQGHEGDHVAFLDWLRCAPGLSGRDGKDATGPPGTPADFHVPDPDGQQDHRMLETASGRLRYRNAPPELPAPKQAGTFIQSTKAGWGETRMPYVMEWDGKTSQPRYDGDLPSGSLLWRSDLEALFVWTGERWVMTGPHGGLRLTVGDVTSGGIDLIVDKSQRGSLGRWFTQDQTDLTSIVALHQGTVRVDAVMTFDAAATGEVHFGGLAANILTGASRSTSHLSGFVDVKPGQPLTVVSFDRSNSRLDELASFVFVEYVGRLDELASFVFVEYVDIS